MIKIKIDGILDIVGFLPILSLLHFIKFLKELIFGKEEKDPYRSKVEVREWEVEIKENKIFDKEG